MKLTLECDPDGLTTYTDSFLMALWNAAQWHKAPGEDPEACRMVEQLGREIIRRWLTALPPELWQRQGVHEYRLAATGKEEVTR